MTAPVSGTAAGVPFLALPPEEGATSDALVVAWHLLDAPRTEVAMAAALPLAGLPAWRVYLGLPLTGRRPVPGGHEELLRLGYEDAVLRLHGPIAGAAVAEAPAAVAELRDRLGLAGPLGVVGGSLGAAVAQLVVAEAGLGVAAAVLVSPVVRLRAVVEGLSARFGMTYAWSPPADAVADRLDLVARADETVRAGQPAVRLVVGADDLDTAFLGPARELQQALAARYDDPSRVDLVVVPGMAHALAEEPGTEPAPQTPAAARVDALATAWLAAHLGLAPG